MELWCASMHKCCRTKMAHYLRRRVAEATSKTVQSFVRLVMHRKRQCLACFMGSLAAAEKVEVPTAQESACKRWANEQMNSLFGTVRM